MIYTVRKCLFPAAGYGTRFLPVTKAMPKEMLPILNKPLIQYGVEEAVEAGMTSIAFVTGRGKRAIEDHFDINYEVEHEVEGTAHEKSLEGIRRLIQMCRFSYTRQIRIEGLGQAILTGETLIGNEPFGVVLADDLCISESGPGALAQLMAVFNKYQCCVVAVQKVNQEELDRYGVISGEEIEAGIIEVTDLVEKPLQSEAPSNLGIIGRYILTPDIFEAISRTKPGKGGEIQITDALKEQAIHKRVIACEIECKRFDCGNINGFAEATQFVFQRYRDG